MKARVASAHLILSIAYNILKTGEPYKELGPEYVLQKKKQNQEQKMINYLKKKGYSIDLPEQGTA